MPRSCDVCQTSNALLFCRADAAYLCMGCDVKVHKANELASRHEREWMCEVCEQAPAMFACKADAAVLCVSCDADIHSANRLAGRHERVRVAPFFESPSMVKHDHINVVVPSSGQDADSRVEDEENCEVEAASWLLPHPQPSIENTFKNDWGAVRKNEDGDIGGRWDDNLSAQKEKLKIKEDPQHTDGLTRVDPYLELEHVWEVSHGPVQSADLVLHKSPLSSNGSGSMELEKLSSKDECIYTVNFSSHSLSSCSTESGVVPDVTSSDLSTPRALLSHVDQVEPMAREARVLRYLEKRKNRKFEKTIRYASRKAYAETRPRIKGRFVKRSDSNSEQIYSVSDAGFVVTSC